MSQQINLFNPIFLKQKKYFSAVTMAQALGMILLGCAALIGYVNYQLSALSKEAEATTRQLGAVQTQVNKINATYGLRQKTKSIEEEIQKTETEVESLQRVFDVLQKGDFGNTKGYAEYMRAFSRQIVNGVWLTGFSIHGAGNEIGLQGRALQPDLVPAYITRLKREQVLQGKTFAALDMQIPPNDQNEKASPAATKQRVAPYIEFSLQSSGTLKEQAGSSGEKNK